MRRMLLDYGKSFEKRAESLIALMIILNLFSFGFIVMGFLDVLPMETKDLGLIIIQFLIIFFYLVKFLYLTAVVNQHFKIHIFMLKEIKETLSQLLISKKQ